jgi:hypothetical protein
MEIEEGVRQWVYLLRNVGINTECSCHHKGYIQCQTLDPTTEIFRIKSVLLENGIEDFDISIIHKGTKCSSLEIHSPSFVKNCNV